MSDIHGNLGMDLPEGKTQDDFTPFPYRIVTDYKNKLMAVTVAGNWSGSVDDAGIVVSTNTVIQPGYSIISFIFTNADRGASTTVLLTDNDNDVTYSLGLDYIG
jgi:hypothetical protein